MKTIILSTVAVFVSFAVFSQNWQVYNTSNSGVIGNDVTGLTLDKKGNIWLTTAMGISKYNGSAWKNYPLQFTNLRTIRADSNDVIFFGGEKAMYFLEDDSVKYFPPNKGYDCRSIYIDSSNVKWLTSYNDIDTSGGGIGRYQDGNFYLYNPANSGMPHRVPACVSMDKKGILWIGKWIFANGDFLSSDPLTEFNPKTNQWKEYGVSAHRLLTNESVIQYIASDKKNVLWFSLDGETHTRGDSCYLMSYNGSSFNVYLMQGITGSYKDQITCIYIDENDIKWIGTRYGLIRYDNISFKYYSGTQYPLLNNYILDIATDKSGVMWLATYNGLVKVSDLNSVEENAVSSNSIQVWPNPFSDGLNVLFNQEIDSKKISVYVFDIMGTDVTQRFTYDIKPIFEGSFSIKNMGADKGIYFLIIEDNSHHRIIGRTRLVLK